jgi:hypothetical protein
LKHLGNGVLKVEALPQIGLADLAERAAERRLERCIALLEVSDAFGHRLHDHSAAIVRIAVARDEPGRDQAVNDARDSSGRQAQDFGQLPGGGGPEVLQHGQTLQISGSNAELLRDGLAEGGMLRRTATYRAYEPRQELVARRLSR